MFLVFLASAAEHTRESAMTGRGSLASLTELNHCSNMAVLSQSQGTKTE